jgi:large subunit ribosomal protein L3
MPSSRSQTGMIGRKVGMMRLYDGGGRSRGVTVIELGSNFVTQVRTPERDGYAAVQVGFPGGRKRLNRPERGHLRTAGLEGRTPVLSRLQEFRLADASAYTVGQTLSVEQFEPGSFVDVTATSKGRGFQGGVKRHNFRGGPKTHGQSDRHRAPGSIGSGTTPGRVFKGLKMAGHMGAETVTVLNLLVVAVDPSRNLIFVEGSVPGHRNTVVTVGAARRPALKEFAAPVIPSAEVAEVVEDEVVEDEVAVVDEPADEAPAAEAQDEAPAADDAADEAPAAEGADETAEAQSDEAQSGEAQSDEAQSAEAGDDESSDEQNKSEA